MNRRGFIQISSVAILPILMGIFPRNKGEKKPYSIKVHSNRKFGHLLRKYAKSPATSFSSVDYLIIGGGIAGLSAAAALKNENIRIIEAGDRLGGSSASDAWKTAHFAMGAHYELAYPDYFDKNLIEFLQKIKVLNSFIDNGLYSFVDRQYIINPKNAEQCFSNGKQLDDVLNGADGIDAFYDHLEQFVGKMPLPTRLISEKYQHLGFISFKDYLIENNLYTADLAHRISYQMLDDWGGNIEQVSALAGIHYYTCRPYNEQNVPIFSPPNGNAYFIEKLVGHINQPKAIETGVLARKIKPVADGVIVETIRHNGNVEEIKAKGVVYAGQKHSLPYLLADKTNLFVENQYAPWLVINFVCKPGSKFEKWQNDVLTDKLDFLGFVNSAKQHQRAGLTHEVLTAYYCFSPDDRSKLVNYESYPEQIIEETIRQIKEQTNGDIEPYIEHVNINLMGHAMPIPAPGYLSFDTVPHFNDRLVFAGVDTGRLPLFSEACDSGLQAGQFLKNISEKVIPSQS